jgi:hypothetical protein
MDEVLPGVLHWTVKHPKIGIEVSSHWIPEAGALIDPLLPAEGLDAFRERPPERILLSNRHHLRHSEQLANEFGCTVRCPEPGLHEFKDGPAVEGFAFGEEAAPGILALEVGAICPDESALLIEAAQALLMADGVIHYGEELSFVPDQYMVPDPHMGDDLEGVKAGLQAAYSKLLDRDFDNLLFAHGDPMVGGAKAVLRDFCEK